MKDDESPSPENQKTPDDQMVQRVIDPQTGRDITAEYISARLKELEKFADELIKDAMDEVVKQPTRRKEIYEKTYWEIHEKLGMGSIGPATAAAGPLMAAKKIKLAKLLGVNHKDRIS